MMTTSLSEAIDSHLAHYQQAGLLQPTKPRRFSPQHYRRERRLSEAVDALVALLLDYSYEEYVEPCTAVYHLRSGMNFNLEEQANLCLAEGRRGDLKLSDPGDWLTTEQVQLRLSREVYCTQGQPDSALKSGLYRRTYNPLAGQRPTRLNGGEDTWG